MQKTSEKTTTISCTVPKSIGDKLEFYAKNEERSKSYYVKKGLELLFNEKEENEFLLKDGKKAWEEFKESGEKTVSWEDVKAELALPDNE